MAELFTHSLSINVKGSLYRDSFCVLARDSVGIIEKSRESFETYRCLKGDKKGGERRPAEQATW